MFFFCWGSECWHLICLEFGVSFSFGGIRFFRVLKIIGTEENWKESFTSRNIDLNQLEIIPEILLRTRLRFENYRGWRWLISHLDLMQF